MSALDNNSPRSDGLDRRRATAGIGQRHPEASDEEVWVRLAVRLYGREAAMRLFGDVPADAV